jgi:hypothetical protein
VSFYWISVRFFFTNEKDFCSGLKIRFIGVHLYHVKNLPKLTLCFSSDDDLPESHIYNSSYSDKSKNILRLANPVLEGRIKGRD